MSRKLNAIPYISSYEDIRKEMQNKNENGYSNIIIHPDGRIAVKNSKK